MDNGIIIRFPVIVKARSGDGRIVEVEASNERKDSEGDVILQKALLDSADSFIKSGNLDLDHLSELGARLGIPNPTSYIVGRPLEVNDLGDQRTGVVGEIRRSSDGKVDVKKNRYDEFWDSLQSSPPVTWQASIYGFPKNGMVVDCREEVCDSEATRYLVKGIDWRSMAFTRNPINTSLKGHVRIVTAKAFMDAFRKDAIGNMSLALPSPAMPMMGDAPPAWPRNLDDLWGQYIRHMPECSFVMGQNSTVLFRDHFAICCGMDIGAADLCAHALMYLVVKEKKREADAKARA